MRGVNGCFVCDQSYRPKDYQPRQEATSAIKNLRVQLPTALITVADMVFIIHSYASHEDDDEAANEEAIAEWAEQVDVEITDDIFLLYITEPDLLAI